MAPVVKSVTLRKLKAQVDHLRDVVAGRVEHSLFKSVHRRYTDFVINLSELQALNHTGVHTTNSITFDPQAKGDKWSSLYMVARLPGIQRNANGDSLVGRTYDSYYIQSAGYALIKEITIKSGNVDGFILNDRDLYHAYQAEDAHADDEVDPRIHRYSTLSQIKQVSQGNQIWNVPIYHSMLRWNNIPQNYSMNAALRQATELKVTLKSLLEITVNEAQLTVLPYKFGTSTAIASSDVQIQFFSHFMIMSPEERELEREQYMSRHGKHTFIQYPFTITRDSTEAIGKQITWSVSPNHPCSGYYIYFQPYSYIDKTEVSPQGVGLVNYYDFSARHGGEVLYALDLKYNGGSYLDATHPISWLRSIWKDHHEKIVKPYTTMYFVAYATKIDSDHPTTTVNHSNIDKIDIIFNKNVSDSGTFFATFLIHNIFSFKDGFAGQQFV